MVHKKQQAIMAIDDQPPKMVGARQMIKRGVHVNLAVCLAWYGTWGLRAIKMFQFFPIYSM